MKRRFRQKKMFSLKKNVWKNARGNYFKWVTNFRKKWWEHFLFHPTHLGSSPQLQWLNECSFGAVMAQVSLILCFRADYQTSVLSLPLLSIHSCPQTIVLPFLIAKQLLVHYNQQAHSLAMVRWNVLILAFWPFCPLASVLKLRKHECSWTL